MGKEKGNISINTENILPIIKKWLYSDRDIFIRELVSNCNDAISKFKRLTAIGEAKADENEKYEIRVIVNKDDKTIKFIDNGIGMTGEEVKKYINQIAFSGAKDFLEKYKDKADESNQIIGHFGLGFYSAFMVSERVQVDTLSYEEGATAVRWTSNGTTEYEMEDSDRTQRGTTVTLYVAADGEEFLDEYKMRQVLLKYCSFLPFELYLEDVSKEALEEKKKRAEEREKARKEAKKKAEEKKAEKEKDKKDKDKSKAADAEKAGGDVEEAEDVEAEVPEELEEAEEEPKPLNDTKPLWLKNPKDCTDEEYKEFYRKVFFDFNEPLFWVHLNLDYPFRLKGILYFPKLKHEFETMEGQIKLYYNQVFVADNIKEIIPEFLLLLKGTIDCPDLPLNVSRSFLQNDGYVNKLSTHITKKVGDKLTSLFENEREGYNKYWDDIHPFVKYGCMREEKFYDRVKDIIIYKTTSGDYVTLNDYLERNKSKHENKVFYVSDEKQQAQYIKLFKEHEMEAIYLSSMIDNHFIQFLETKQSDIKFSRVDADISENLKEIDSAESEEENKKTNEELEKIFKEVLSDDKLKIQVENLKTSSIPGMILLSEQSRRMQEMSRMFGGADMSHMFPNEQTLVLNKKNSLIKSILGLSGNETRKDDVKMLCHHIYDLAMISHKQLDAEAMTKFIERSNEMMTRLAQSESQTAG
jgi:molecular chaperone HtpG